MTEKRLTRAKAIRAKCLDCCCGYAPEVRNCHIKECPLWPDRVGHGEEKAEDLSTEDSEG